jgi:hypothetical protein
VALWKGGLPVDVLPPEGVLEVALGEENFAWEPEQLVETLEPRTAGPAA